MEEHIIARKKVIEKLKQSSVFQDWQKNNKNSFLSHIFYMLSTKKEDCQVGYYDKERNIITSFEVGDDVKILSEEEPFKPEGMEVKELNPESAKLDFKEAIAIVEDLQKNKYPSEKPVEIVAILQNLEALGNVYNITHISRSFKTLNAKVNAENGDIVDEKLVSIAQFPQDKQNTGQ